VPGVGDSTSLKEGARESAKLLPPYLAALGAAVAALAFWLVHTGHDPSSWWAVLLLAVLAAAAERGNVRLSPHLEVSVSLVPTLLAAVALGPVASMVTGGTSMLGDLRPSRMRFAVYTLSRSLTGGVAGLTALGVSDALGRRLGAIVVATVAAALAAQALDAGFASLTLALRGTGGLRDILPVAPALAMSTALYAPLVALLVFAYDRTSPWTLVLFVIPALAAHRLLVLYQRERALSAELTAANAHLHRRDAILQTVSAAARRFLETTSFDDAVQELLAELGDAAEADHVAVLGTEDGQIVLRHSWSRAGAEPLAPLVQGGPREGVDAFVPVVAGQEDWGLIGFPARSDEREWSTAEVDGLRAAAGILGAAIERRRAEEELRARDEQLRQSQKMEAVGRLAGGIAHDFNNLLTVIAGYSDSLLLGLEADHAARADALAIRGAARRAAALTGQLLAFSRKQVLAPEILDLNDVLREAGMLLQRLLGDDIELTVELDEHLAPILADPGHLQQIVLNLAINARDAMSQGGRLLVRTANADAAAAGQASAVLLEVVDTGHGMDAATRERIFEPFFTTKDIGKGTGLGLAMVHGIVEESGGRIEVDSEPEHGTAFRIYFPVAADDPDPDAGPAAPPEGSETTGGDEPPAAPGGLGPRKRTLRTRWLSRPGTGASTTSS
jgi:signal transduction histidine kinase